MKNLILLLLLLLPLNIFADFIHPMDFDGSKAQKDRVIKIIKARVQKDYCKNKLVNMCQPTTLRMMEQENLDAFKKATKATNRGIMDKVVNDYCNNKYVDMCNYSTIWMMYLENLKASQKSLAW